jgi:hypothetical protein
LSIEGARCREISSRDERMGNTIDFHWLVLPDRLTIFVIFRQRNDRQYTASMKGNNRGERLRPKSAQGHPVKLSVRALLPVCPDKRTFPRSDGVCRTCPEVDIAADLELFVSPGRALVGYDPMSRIW